MARAAEGRGPRRGPANLEKRSFALSGHRTSVALEPEFWSVLEGFAAHGGRSLSSLVGEVDARRDAARPLASALRVYVVTTLSDAGSDNRDEVSHK